MRDKVAEVPRERVSMQGTSAVKVSFLCMHHYY
jgi:hypothetical protein